MSIQKKNFSDLVTFTRASGGTSFRPIGRGTLVNQLLYSQLGGGGTTPAGWYAWAGGGTEGALLPSGLRQRVFVSSASQPFIHQTISLAANTTYTFVVYVHENVGGITQNNVLFWGGSMPTGAVFTVPTTVAPSESFVLATITTAATAGSLVFRVGGGAQSNTTGSVTLSGPALFTGTVTAQQIIDNGGIPITFASPDNVVRIDAQGDPIQLFTVPANYPRRDYDPVTGACKGLLVEEQRTNLITYSSDLSGSSWTKASVTPSPNAALAPDGTMTATKVVAPVSASDVYHAAYASWVVVTGATYTYSRYVKASGYTKVRVADIANGRWYASFDLASGQVSNTGGAAFVSAGVTPLSDGWWRLSLTLNTSLAGNAWLDAVGYPDSGAVLTNWGVTYAGDGVSGIFVWGAQMEAGAFPTSYIPTSGAAATRAGDVPVVNTLSPWFNATENTIYIEAASSSWTNQAIDFFLLGVNSPGASHAKGIARFSGLSIQAHDGTQYRVLPNSSYQSGGLVKLAFSQTAGGTASASTSGSAAAAVITDGDLFDGVTSLTVGARNSGISQWCGHIRRIQYIPKRLSDAKLQALTTLTYGAPYGPELATGWTASGVGVAVSGQSVVLTNASPSAGVGIAGGQLVATKTYVMTMTISGFSSDVGGISFCSGGMNGAGIGAIYTANGTFTQTITAATTETFGIRARNSNVTATVTCSVREATAQ